MEEARLNGSLSKFKNDFIIAYLDTNNGYSKFVAPLGVKRNQSYAIVLQPFTFLDGKAVQLAEIARLTDPKKITPIQTMLEQSLKTITAIKNKQPVP